MSALAATRAAARWLPADISDFIRRIGTRLDLCPLVHKSDHPTQREGRKPGGRIRIEAPNIDSVGM